MSSSNCVVYGYTKLRFIKDQEGKHFLSNLLIAILPTPLALIL